MRAAGPLKIILLLIGLGAVGLIVFNILSRRSPQAESEPAPLLSPDVESRSTRFEYAEREEGRDIFNVSAATSTLTREGLQSLESPRLVLYNREGGDSDTIEGRRALYRMEEKQIEFLDDVRIRLADKTFIRSSKVQADLGQNVILIDQHFDFQRGDATGTGRSLSYHINERHLTAFRFHLTLPTSRQPLEAWAEEAFYEMPREKIRLSGAARIERAGGRLEAGLIDVLLTPERRLQRLVSQGRARFSPLGGQLFEGDRMVKEFDPQAGRLTRLEVFSAPGDSAGPRAAYQRSLPKGLERLEADRITAQPGNGGRDDETFAFEHMLASGRVNFSSQPLRVAASRSDRFAAAFSSDGADLEQLDLQGGVEIERRLPNDVQQRLKSRRLQMEFEAGQVLRRVQADGQAELETQSPGLHRRLTARQSIHFDFEDGLPARAQARGGCRVESDSGEGVNSLEAPSIDLFLRGGKPQRVTAGEGVEAELGAQSTRSRTLQLDYRDGKLFKARQSGDFRLSDPAAGVELQGDEAVFDPAAETAVVGGPAGPYLLLYNADPANPESEPSRSLARSFLLRRSQGRLSSLQASGQVSSRFESQKDPLTIKAAIMSADPGQGVIEYRQGVVVEQPRLKTAARRVRLRQSDRSLEAQGDVESSFQDPQRPEERSFRVRAQGLSFEPQAGRAHYEEGVRLETEDLEVESPLLDVVLDEASGSVRQVSAWGGVLVRPDQRREISGERLEYDPSRDEVVITGNPVVMTDPKEGKASGTRLTFKVGSDSLRMGSPPRGSRP